MNTGSNLYLELSDSEIRLLVKANFDANLLEAKLLDGGMFNTTYLICYGEDRKQAVLRCGPVNRQLLMAFEENLMQAENYVDQLCERYRIPCSRVLVYDTTGKLIDRDYMMVEYIKSLPLSSEQIPQEEKSKLYCQVGEYMRRFHSVKGNSFGRVSYLVEGKCYATWYEYLIAEIDDIMGKLGSYRAFTEDEAEQIRSAFEMHETLLNQVTVPRLVHTDLWEGNVLVSRENCEYSVAAIIDTDRALFGDIDFEFASPWMMNEDFFKGYDCNLNRIEFNSESRRIRRQLYLILYDLIETYVGVAEYNNQNQYDENKKLVMELVSGLI